MEKIKKLIKMKKMKKKNEKIEKMKIIFCYIFLIISYKFGAYIKRFRYTLLTTWQYL